MPFLVRKTKGADVLKLQGALLALEYDLPKYGADGDFGYETLHAVQEYAHDHGIDATAFMESVPDALIETIIGAKSRPPRVGLLDIARTTPSKGNIIKGSRAWKDITGITLHQTGIMMSNKPERFKNVPAHFAVIRERPFHGVVQMHDMRSIVWHGNAFNKPDVGIEINGCFAGIEGDPRTAWKGGFAGNPGPDSITDQQIHDTRLLVTHIYNTVYDEGGRLRHIHAHRQTNGMKLSDPGSKVWQEVGMWAQRELGLTDGGPGYTLREGAPIPEAWDSRYTGVPYRPRR